MSKHDTLDTSLSPVVVASPSNTPLVAPETVSAGEVTTPSDKATLYNGLAVSNALAATLSERAEEAKRRSEHLSATQSAIAEYWQAVADNETNTANGQAAALAIESATAHMSTAFANAIQAEAMTRQEVRRKLGETFGFKPSATTGKPTSTPNEPGNSISKRVSSVTIAVEYLYTGILPDKGGKSLPDVGQEKLSEILSDYFEGNLTVRAASERIEAAVREAKTNIPLELNADKLATLIGKIQTAQAAIAKDAELQEVYAVLFETIAAIPFSATE